MKKSTKIRIEILSLLNDLEEPAERISLIEKIGKDLRQANSIATSKEVEAFTRKNGVKKDIEYGTVPKAK